jgi:hypothetical protein
MRRDPPEGMCIRNRPDGVTEVTPKFAPMRRDDRWLVILTVLMASTGFFMAGVLPPAALAAMFCSCLAGEVVLGVKALVLFLLKPPAEVYEMPVEQLRRRAR